MSFDFEKCMNEIRDCVKQLESADLSLDKSLEIYERGVALTRQANEYLSNAEKRMTVQVLEQPKK